MAIQLRVMSLKLIDEKTSKVPLSNCFPFWSIVLDLFLQQLMVIPLSFCVIQTATVLQAFPIVFLSYLTAEQVGRKHPI